MPPLVTSLGQAGLVWPSLRRMLAAQLLSFVIGLPAALLLTLQLIPFFSQLQWAGVDARLVGFFSNFAAYFAQGVLFGGVQLFFLRRSIPRWRGWLVVSGLLAVILLPGLFPFTAWLLGGAPSAAQVTSLPGVLLCAIAGGLFGFFFAAVQSLWLRVGSGRWLVLGMVAWGSAWAAAFPAIYQGLFL